jgi:hypothetical protein
MKMNRSTGKAWYNIAELKTFSSLELLSSDSIHQFEETIFHSSIKADKINAISKRKVNWNRNVII